MLLRGSCHCGAVAFTLKSTTPYPYMRCYCSICRKTDGGGGYAINIMGEAATLKVKGKAAISIYRARLGSGKSKKTSTGRRHFCSHCGSALWVADPRWPEWVYPFASAIDTKLPLPPQHCNIMLDFAAPWSDIAKASRKNIAFARYPDAGILEWHKKRGLLTG